MSAIHQQAREAAEKAVGESMLLDHWWLDAEIEKAADAASQAWAADLAGLRDLLLDESIAHQKRIASAVSWIEMSVGTPSGGVDRGRQLFDLCSFDARGEIGSARGRNHQDVTSAWAPGDRLVITANGNDHRMAITTLRSNGEWEAISEKKFLEYVQE